MAVISFPYFLNCKSSIRLVPIGEKAGFFIFRQGYREQQYVRIVKNCHR